MNSIFLFYFSRYLKEKNYTASRTRHGAFWSSRLVREEKDKIDRMDGKGKVPNRAKSLSREEENVLWESGQLGRNSSRFFIQTIWSNNLLHFGMRGRDEHHSL